MKNYDNLEEYPRLTPPEVVYEGKAALKKPAIIPMYAKIISAAAAVALLVTLFWKPWQRPELPLMAGLSPIASGIIETEQPLRLSGERAHFATSSISVRHESVSQTKPSISKPSTPKQLDPLKQGDLPLLASLSPCSAQALPSDEPSSLLMLTDLSDAVAESWSLPDEDDEDLSLARKGFQKMTDGKYDGIGDLLRQGWRSVKGELAQLNYSVSDGITSIKQRE